MAKKLSKRKALDAKTKTPPDMETIINILIKLGDEHWKEDADKDRTTAIMGATFVEYGLQVAITRRMPSDADDPEFKYLFGTDTEFAPLSDFSSKIKMARALGIISKDEKSQIDCIRSIRNAFAHTMSPISFQTGEIASFFEDLKILEDSVAFKDVVDAFSQKYSLLGMTPGTKANRMLYAQAVFMFYQKLTKN